MATNMAANCAKYCAIGNLALILQVIVADYFEKCPIFIQSLE